MKYRYGKVALVVGASSGVGLSCAKYLSKQGYTVYGTSRKARFDDNAKDGIQMIPLDVTIEESIHEAVNYVIKKENEIGILINCPGYGLSGAVEDISIKEAKDIFDTNFFGIMNICQIVLPYMREKKRGLIVNISSVAGFIAIPYQSMYSASKYALEAMTEAMRIEVKPFGVSVSMIEPGDMNTNFYRVTAQKAQNSVYKARCDKAVGEMIRSEHNGPTSDVVVKELKKIVNKKNPPIKTIVGLQYKLIGFIKRLVPNKMIEYIVTKIY